MNTRLLGAAVLIALAVLFVPMFFSEKPPAAGDQTVSLAIPQAPDRELQTRTMNLTPAGTEAGTPPAAAPAQAVPSDQLATVNIGSNRPLDVETDPNAGKPHEKTTVTMGSGASPTQPVIPMQGAAAGAAPKAAPAKATAAAPAPAQAPPATAAARPATPQPAPQTAAAAPTRAAGEGAGGAYRINLSSYANQSNVTALRGKVQALGYPTSVHAVTQAGRQLTQVTAGPFATRTAAEAARLKIAQGVQGVQPQIEAAGTPARTLASAAAPAAASGPGGWVVQLAALGSQTDANALRDRLRAGGFDGYVSQVQADGHALWQVRAGPQTQRADAQRVQSEIKAKLGIDGVIRRVP